MPSDPETPTQGSAGGDEPAYPLLTNRPGVIAVDPVRRVRIAAVLFCVALAGGTIAGSFFATRAAGQNTERRVAALRDETRQIADDLLANMDRRTADRKRNEAVGVAILEQNRRTLCALMRDVRQRGQSNDEIDELYEAYHCEVIAGVVVEPGWSPPPGWPALPGSRRIAPTPSAKASPAVPPVPGG